MIVCSQSCFLNVLTQLYPKETLINAMYYIADLTGPGNIKQADPNNPLYQTSIGDEETWKYNEEGELVKVKTGKPVQRIETMQKYHIKYTRGALNPASLCTVFRLGNEPTASTPEERYINSLKKTDHVLEVYEDLFKDKPRGNGLQVLIFSNDETCCKFGWILCDYLSKCFGADIIFLDAKYRKKIAPQSKVQYPGDKKFATETFLPQIRDALLLDSVENAMTRSTRECISNLTTKLAVMNWNQLIYLYELLWPMDPLPQGNYSEDQLKEIIIYKCMGQKPPSPYDALDNLYNADAFYQMANEYDE